MSCRSSRILTVSLLVVAACSSTPSVSPLEAALPVAPGEPWEEARTTLEKLDPQAREAEGVGGRTTVAKATVTVAGVRFDEVSIAGVASRPQVRAVKLTAPSPGDGCDRVRAELLDALGSGWSAGEPRLGAITATKGTTRSARIVCTGAELSVSIIG